MKRQTATIRSKSTDGSFQSIHCQTGFTLIEVMVAFVVLLVGMLGIMGMQYFAVTGNTFSREMRIATNLSQQVIEQLKTTPYANLANNNDQPFLGNTENSITGGMQNLNITREWWVVPDCVGLAAAPAPAANTCNNQAPACANDPDGTVAVRSSAIRATTCWRDKNNVPHSVTLDSLRWDENAIP